MVGDLSNEQPLNIRLRRQKQCPNEQPLPVNIEPHIRSLPIPRDRAQPIRPHPHKPRRLYRLTSGRLDEKKQIDIPPTPVGTVACNAPALPSMLGL